MDRNTIIYRFMLVILSEQRVASSKRTNADARQTKAILAARIIGVLDDEQLSTRAAQARTGVDQSEFFRIRNARLERFTIDRLITILNLLGREVDVRVSVRRRVRAEPALP